MLIREMVAKVCEATGCSKRAARQFISDGAERLDFACDFPEDTYTDQDVVDVAIHIAQGGDDF